MVLLIIRIKMCLAKMIRLLLSIKKIPQRSRRSAPRYKPKRLWPTQLIYGNSGVFFKKGKSKWHNMAFNSWIIWIQRRLKSLQRRRPGAIRFLFLFPISWIFPPCQVLIILILIPSSRRYQILLIELLKLLKVIKISFQFLYIFRV